MSPEALAGLKRIVETNAADWIARYGRESFEVRKDSLVLLWIERAIQTYSEEHLEGFTLEAEDSAMADASAVGDWPDGADPEYDVDETAVVGAPEGGERP